MRGALLVVVLFLPVASADFAEAVPIDVQGLPDPPRILAFASSHWDGRVVHILGGSDRLAPGGQQSTANFYDTLIKYDPSTDTYSRPTPVLSSPRSHMASAEWNGALYLFGGFRGWEADPPGLSQIVRYDPATRQAELMDARLPWPTWGVAAVPTPHGILLFGGYGCPGGCPVLRYDPASDSIETQAATVPGQPYMMAAAWDGERVVVMGGRPTSFGRYQDDVYVYDPRADVMEAAEPLLFPTGSSAALVTGDMVLLVGGAAREVEPQAQVHRYHVGLKLPGPSLPLPDAHYAATGVWADDRGYIFGAGGRNADAFCLCPPVVEVDSIEGVAQGARVGFVSVPGPLSHDRSSGSAPTADAGASLLPLLAFVVAAGAVLRRRC